MSTLIIIKDNKLITHCQPHNGSISISIPNTNNYSVPEGVFMTSNAFGKHVVRKMRYDDYAVQDPGSMPSMGILIRNKEMAGEVDFVTYSHATGKLIYHPLTYEEGSRYVHSNDPDWAAVSSILLKEDMTCRQIIKRLYELQDIEEGSLGIYSLDKIVKELTSE